MILDAISVGELAHALATGRAKGIVRRVFHSSVYLESSGGLVLLLRGALKSPMTINVVEGPDFIQALKVDEAFQTGDGVLRLGETEVRLDAADVFRSALLNPRRADPISGAEIVRGAASLKLLYSASEAALDFASGRAFRAFADSVLRPLAMGRTEQARSFSNYVGLLGSGTGFTPAGDDFVAGFTAAFNYHARGTGEATILLSLAELRGRTVRESAALVDYAQRGYVDEGLQSLILAGLDGKPLQFRAHLSELASRGHTSGLDMSLGVLMLLASVSDRTREGRALESSLEVLGDW